MKQIALFALMLALGFNAGCRSSKPKKETETTRERSRLGDPEPDAEAGGFYRLRKNVTGFYFDVPSFIQVLPDRYLMRGHIVQLLDSSSTGGWARVKNEDLQTGYVKYESLKIVPWEDQPKPKTRKYDEELNQRLGVR